MIATLDNKRIAVLGATGYIGRSLMHDTSARGYEVTACSRDPKKAKETLKQFGIEVENLLGYEHFLDNSFDVVINATGVGSPREIASNPTKVFGVTEEMDDLVFSYLSKYPDCRVFNLSSGSVYGLSARQPVTEDTKSSFDLEKFTAGDYYAMAKLHSEFKHRSWSDKRITDLRVFAFISRFLDIEETFFIAEVAKCLTNREIFKTKPEDMLRDYSTAADIWDVIEFLMALPPQNTAFDMKSLSPVGKFELLEYLSKNLGLKYEKQQLEGVSPTGEKNAYYSNSEKLAELGFKSNSTSLENVVCEISSFLTSKTDFIL